MFRFLQGFAHDALYKYMGETDENSNRLLAYSTDWPTVGWGGDKDCRDAIGTKPRPPRPLTTTKQSLG